MALIDTGSRYSVIAQDTREQLGLLRVGEEPVLLPGPGTCQLMPTYATRFLLAPGIPFETAAVEMDIGDLGAILGRDMLSRATLTYFGRANKVTVTFPPS